MANPAESRSPVLSKMWSLFDLIVEVVLFTVDVIRVFVLGMPTLFQRAFRMVFPNELKNVAGQLVLVNDCPFDAEEDDQSLSHLCTRRLPEVLVALEEKWPSSWLTAVATSS